MLTQDERGTEMRKVIVTMCLLMFMTGCSLWPAKNAAIQNRKNWDRIVPAHEKYLEEAEKAGKLTKANVENRKLFLKEARDLAKKMEELGK